MSAVELDPQFIKALRLLRSKSKDSGAQLKAMLDEAIRQRRGLSSGVRSPHGGRAGSSERLVMDRERDKKKDLDRLKKDLSELTERPPEAKRSRLESPALSSSSHTPSPTPPPSREGDQSDAGVGSDEDMDLEINLEDQFDCSCCVCKTLTQESGNKLMECSSCQNLYHQECHNPPVSNEKANDPRLIWNCDKCSNKGKSTGSKPSTISASSGFKDERKVEKEKSKSSSSSSSSLIRSGSSSSSSSKHKPSPAKSESRSGVSSSSLSSSSKIKTGSVSSSLSISTGVGPGELSSNAKKRMKLIKQQAADMSLSNIGKKKLPK